MGRTIRWGAAAVVALGLAVTGTTGCTSNPLVPTEVLFLQVVDLENGTGREAMAGDRVVIDYVIWTYDSEQADSKGREIASRDGYTFFLGANQVSPVLDQGLVGMRVGGLRRLIVPGEYARGVGAFASVPPNAPSVAEVRMVDAQAPR